MFETAELDHRVPRAKYEAEVARLRTELLQAHFALHGQKSQVLVIVAGVEAAGKGELVHRLNEWLDPRGVETHAFWDPSDEETERPPYWRYWRAMPGRGRIGILFGSWYTEPILQRVYGKMKSRRFDTELDRIVAFEKMLTDDATILVKLWLHLPKPEQKERLKKLDKEGRLAPDDWQHFRQYDTFVKVSERALRRTDVASAPWHIIEATHRRYRELTAGQILLGALRAAGQNAATKSSAESKGASKPEKRPEPVAKSDSVLAHVDLTQALSKSAYKQKLDVLQGKLSGLAWMAHKKKRSVVLAFEGWDAAGKGSAIRRVTQALDPRLYRVIGISAPTDEERAQHYLWRFWRHLPRAGFTAIFDRSWYGRVLVERVEGFARPDEWGRAYHEINEFEEQLEEHGIIVLKFWLHVSREEQLRRFKDRERVAYKRYKITDEDWRNRDKWPEYQRAVDEMIEKCSTEFAPWTIVPANDKHFARIFILKTIVDKLSEEL